MSESKKSNKPGAGRPKVNIATNSMLRVIDDGIAELTFLPSPEHRRIKSAFWASIAENPILDPASDGVSLAAAQRITGDARLPRWWQLPGFKEWFANKDEFRQRVEYLANLALDVAEEVLLDRDAHPSARVNMTKLVIEVANKIPSRASQKDENKFLDARIAQMGREELEEFIRKQTKMLLPQQETVTIDDILAESEEK